MTIILMSHTRKTDRNPQKPRHEGPLYPVRAIREALAKPQRPSVIYRLVEYYSTHPWIARVMFGFGLLVAAATLAAWICL